MWRAPLCRNPQMHYSIKIFFIRLALGDAFFLKNMNMNKIFLKNGFSTSSYSENFAKKLNFFQIFCMDDNFSLGPPPTLQPVSKPLMQRRDTLID